jgi:hypothetical protein
MLRTVNATRYVTPLREGGSLPGLVEADDDGLYVVKFRAAGQGLKALVAELLVGELGRAVGLPVPEIVLVQVPAALGRTEPDPEINELVTGSAGLNCGLDFLPGSLDYNAAQPVGVDATLASEVVWFDAFTTNVDRTARNPNMLCWHDQTWLIDHGAALYQHHGTENLVTRSDDRFALIVEHVLLPYASELEAADARLSALLPDSVLSEALSLLPDEWLGQDPAAARAGYLEYFHARLHGPRSFLRTALEAAGGA